jgi:DNA-binding SARP family transcriptional activator
MTLVRLHTLGQCVIETEKGRLLPSASVPFGLVVYMAMERGRNVPRTQLLDLFYPDATTKSGSHCLRQILYNLRQMGIPIVAEGRHVQLPAERVVADHDRVFAIPGVDGCAAAAVAGGFLPGFAPALSEGYSEWLEQQRGWVHAQLRRRLLEVMDERRKHGQWAEAERLARACLVIDPLNEEATCVIAESMALAGSKLEAVRLLESYEAEVGRADGNLGLPVRVLRRRICERFSYSEGRAGPLPLIGRDAQMMRLHRELERAARGTMVACVIGGEPGVGKTRLAASFADAAVVVGWRVARVSCQPHDVRRPLGVFSDLVPIVMQLPGALGCSPEATELLTRLFRIDDPGTTELTGQLRDPETLSAGIIRSISELFDAVTSENPLMVVVDSAEWTDPVSRRVALDILSERKDRRLLFAVTTTDPDCLDGRHVNVHPLQLTALSEDDSLALFNHCASRENLMISDTYRTWCLGIAAGNPLFIQTIVAHYAATRMEYDVPRQLTALLQQRLASLSGVSRRSLEACAVLGNCCTVSAMETMLEYPRYQLVDAFLELERAGLVSTDGATVSICHPLLRETALSEMPPGTQRLMHRGAAVALGKELAETSSAVFAWECAQHWAKSGESGRAVEVLRSCARQLMSVGEAAEAAGLLKSAVEFAADAELRLTTLRELLMAADAAGLWQTCVDVIGETEALRSSEDTRWQMDDEAYVIRCDALFRLGHDIGGHVPRLLSIAADSLAPPAIRARATIPSMIHAELCGGVALADNIVRISSQIPRCADAIERLLLMDMIYQATFGDAEAAVGSARRAIQAAHTQDLPASVACRLLSNAGNTFRCVGDFVESARTLVLAYRTASKGRILGSEAGVAGQLCDLCLDVGDLEGAAHWHRRAAELMQRNGAGGHRFVHCLQGALVAAGRGDLRDADLAIKALRTEHQELAQIHSTFLFALEALIAALSHGLDNNTHSMIASLKASCVFLEGHPRQNISARICAWLLREAGQTAEAEEVLRMAGDGTVYPAETRLRGVLSRMTGGSWPLEDPAAPTPEFSTLVREPDGAV